VTTFLKSRFRPSRELSARPSRREAAGAALPPQVRLEGGAAAAAGAARSESRTLSPQEAKPPKIAALAGSMERRECIDARPLSN